MTQKGGSFLSSLARNPDPFAVLYSPSSPHSRNPNPPPPFARERERERERERDRRRLAMAIGGNSTVSLVT